MQSARLIERGYFPDTCQVFHQTTAPNALRETVASYPDTPDRADLPCRLREPKADDATALGVTIEALKETLQTVLVLRCAIDTTIHPTDRIVAFNQRYRVAKVAVVTAYSTALVVALRRED